MILDILYLVGLVVFGSTIDLSITWVYWVTYTLSNSNSSIIILILIKWNQISFISSLNVHVF